MKNEKQKTNNEKRKKEKQKGIFEKRKTNQLYLSLQNTYTTKAK